MFYKRKTVAFVLVFFLMTALLFGECVFANAASFSYEHDPRLNPSAMADIVEDTEAVYGFRPSETGSLKQYASADWSDPAVVEQGRQDRIAYHDSIAELYDLLGKMRAAESNIEEIARAVSIKRNELRLAAYEGNPDGLATVKARNLEQYGHEEGPTPDELYEKYGSWEMVLEKAFSANSGMDACLGLYDDYYDLYVLAGQLESDSDEILNIAEETRISYLGPEGTYTEEATRLFFEDAGVFLPQTTVDEAIAAVLDGSADYAVIPQENTLGGAVTDYVDALIARKDVYVVGEIILSVSQTLMGVPGTTLEDIKMVYSHS